MKHSSFNIGPLKLRPLCCLEISGNNYPETRYHIPEERRIQIPLSALKVFSFINLTTRMRMRCVRDEIKALIFPLTFSCHLLFQPVAAVAEQGGKREGSISDISQPWIGTVWLLSATEVSTDGTVHCCLSCHPIFFTIRNANTSTERFPFLAKSCYITQVVVSQYITRAAELNQLSTTANGTHERKIQTKRKF